MTSLTINMDQKESISFVSVESPYNALLPWTQLRNIQYAILANTHAASLGDATWTPHLCNTQITKFGVNGYIGDSYASFLLSCFGNNIYKYALGREKTLDITNATRVKHMDKIICYIDFGISSGMQSAIDVANEAGIPVEQRKLPPDLMKEVFGQSFMSTVLPITKTVLFYGLMGYGVTALLRKK